MLAALLLLLPELAQAVLMDSPTTKEDADRDLLWSKNERACTPEELSTLHSTDPSITICGLGTMQWDQDGLLTISYAALQGTRYDFVLARDVPNVYITHTAYYNDQACNSFDSCSQNGYPLVDQYQYDCSNVYCGPNARRDCNGNTQSVPCSDGNNPTPIRTHAEVECDRLRGALDEAFSCGPCTSNEGIAEYSCDGGCLGCTANGECLQQVVTPFWLDSRTGVQQCNEFTATGDVLCVANVFGPRNLDRVPISTQCLATWSQEQCACEICGQNELGGPLRSIDCSSVTSVSNSVFNECTGQVSGTFEVLNSMSPDACPAQEQAPVMTPPPVDPPVVVPPTAPAPVASPAQTPDVQPQQTPVEPPVQSPNVQPMQVPVEAPVAESESEPVKDSGDDPEADSGATTTIQSSGCKGLGDGWWLLCLSQWSCCYLATQGLIPFRLTK